MAGARGRYWPKQWGAAICYAHPNQVSCGRSSAFLNLLAAKSFQQFTMRSLRNTKSSPACSNLIPHFSGGYSGELIVGGIRHRGYYGSYHFGHDLNGIRSGSFRGEDYHNLGHGGRGGNHR